MRCLAGCLLGIFELLLVGFVAAGVLGFAILGNPKALSWLVVLAVACFFLWLLSIPLRR